MRETPSVLGGFGGMPPPPVIFFSPRMQNGAIWWLFFFRPLCLNSRTFPGLSSKLQNSRTFPGLEFFISNSRTFPGFQDLWEPCFHRKIAYLMQNKQVRPIGGRSRTKKCMWLFPLMKKNDIVTDGARCVLPQPEQPAILEQPACAHNTELGLPHRSKSTAVYETKASLMRLTQITDVFCLWLFVCITDITRSV